MRHALAAALAVVLGGACASRTQPYRFSSPMIGTAALPLAPTPRAAPPPPARTARPIRAVSAPPIREASLPATALPAPHLLPATAPLPAIHTPLDLRALVGHRDKRDPFAAALALARDLGATADGATGPELVAWAESSHHLAEPTEPAAPGDLLIFDRATSDDEADLVAIVIARDARNVTEYLYLGGGVYRRGFVDPSRPAKRRDSDGAVVNTYLRHGKRWPTKGTHYLAGELLAHVVRTH